MAVCERDLRHLVHNPLRIRFLTRIKIFRMFPPQPYPSAMEPLLLARKTVGRFFEQSANVVCSESITQAIVGKNGSPSYREESKYNYQLQASSSAGFSQAGGISRATQTGLSRRRSHVTAYQGLRQLIADCACPIRIEL